MYPFQETGSPVTTPSALPVSLPLSANDKKTKEAREKQEKMEKLLKRAEEAFTAGKYSEATTWLMFRSVPADII